MESKYAVSDTLPLAQVDACIFGFFAVSVATTCARLFGRLFIFRAFGWDDGLIVASLICLIIDAPLQHLKVATVYPVFELYKTQGAMAYISSVPYLLSAIRYAFVHGLMYVTGLGLIKLSILAFYHRLIINKRHRQFLYVTGSIIVAWIVCHFILSFVNVIPFKAYWDPFKYRGRKVYNMISFQTTNTAFQASFDVVLLVLPIPVLVKMKTSVKIKLGLVFVYLLGTLSLAMTLVRLAKSIEYTKLSALDQGIKNPELTAWSVVEINTAMMCANLPGISAVLQSVFKKRKMTPTQSRATRTVPPSANSQKKLFTPSSPAGNASHSTLQEKSPWSSVGDWPSILRHTELSVDVESGGRDEYARYMI